MLAIILYTTLALMLSLMTGIISSILFNGIGSLNSIETFLAYIVSIVPMSPITFLAVTVSQLCNGSSSAVMLSVSGYIIIVAVCTVFSRINPMVFTSYTGWYRLFIGATMPVTNILSVLILLVAYNMILFGVSSWVFEKKEY